MKTNIQDPCIGEPKKLRIRYLFRDQVHQVTIDDEQMVRAPVKCKHQAIPFRLYRPTRNYFGIFFNRADLQRIRLNTRIDCAQSVNPEAGERYI